MVAGDSDILCPSFPCSFLEFLVFFLCEEFLVYFGALLPFFSRDFRGSILGSAKTDPIRFKWGFGEGFLNDKFAFFEASQTPVPKRRNLLAKRPFL